MTAQEFRQARERLGWTQRATASALGINDRTVRRYEAGTRRIAEPVAKLLNVIADAHAPNDG